MFRKKFFRSMPLIIIFTLVFSILLSGCGSNTKNTSSKSSSGNVTLKFTYWGSPMEKKVVADMVNDFQKSHPNIKINAIHIPTDYLTKISAMVAGGQAPDVAYMPEHPAMEWAQEGKIMDLYPLFQKDKEQKVEDRIDQTWYWLNSSKTKTLGTNTAVEMITLFYNKDMFDKAKVPYPPAKPEEAWTWDQFLQTAIKLTVDKNGKHPDEAGFDPKNIKTYGVAFGTWDGIFLPFVYSNGGNYTDENGTKFMLNDPKAAEAIQKLADLINKYHVAPSPTQLASMPASSITLQTQQVAMTIDGQWSLLDLAKSRFHLGMGVLPKMGNEPKTIVLGAPSVIFTSTKHPKEAWEFYKWHTDAAHVLPLMQQGLWMPLQKKWYTDPQLIKKWTDNQWHPKEYKEAVIDFTLKYAERYPDYYLKNWTDIQKAVGAALDPVWLGKDTAQNALNKVAPKVNSLLKGRFDK